MDLSYETFRELEAAFIHYQQQPGEWDSLIKLNQAFKASGLQNEMALTASQTIDAIALQSVIEEAEWKELESSGAHISQCIEHHLAQMRHHKDKKAPFLDIYEEVQWLRDDIGTIKNHPQEEHLTLWKQAMYAAKKLSSDSRIPEEEFTLKSALHNLFFIESLRLETALNGANFAPYVTLLSQTYEILGKYLSSLKDQAFKKRKKAA